MKKLLRIQLSLKSKLIISFAAILFIPCLTLGWFAYQTSMTNVEKQMKSATRENVQSLNKLIEEYIAPIQKNVDYLSLSLPEEGQVNSFLHAFQSVHPELKTTFVGTSAGLMFLNPEEKLPEGFDPRERPWYKAAMQQAGKTIITDPYVNATNGEIVITLARASADGAKVVGVDLNMTQLAQEVMQVKIGNKGYMTLVDRSQTYLVHPTQKAGTAVPEQLAKLMFAGSETSFESEQGGQAMTSVVATNTLTGWKIAGNLSLQEIKNEASVFLRNTVIIVLLAVLIGSVVIYFIIRSIIVPVKNLIAVTDQVSKGNLSIQVEDSTSKDEIAQLGQSFNRMVDSLREVLREVSQTSSSLAASSEELTASSEQTAHATQYIAENIGQMAEGAELQIGSVKQGSRLVNAMSQDVLGIAPTAKEVSEHATLAAHISMEGNATIQTALSQMNAMKATVESLSVVIRNLTTKSNEISEIVSLISDISSQTNLLSLNASIEAARAGEHGRGFEVVAKEVKKLSEQTERSSKQIITMIGVVQSEAKQAVRSMDNTHAEVTEGMSVMNRAGELFGQIQHAVVELEGQIQNVSTASQQISGGAEQTIQAMDAIMSVVEESASATQNVSAAAQQQLASMEEIAASSEALSKMAIELQEMNEKFTM
ncbi:methyl-accepting chemotaxis protein [Paenibacillus sp. GCM10023252]|uniref:methyl-accepting chemotaxis protein n=1 Tax=Paenibacillus sp. GCM10023252 TaxID=3252649 RepID=UPI00360DD63D